VYCFPSTYTVSPTLKTNAASAGGAAIAKDSGSARSKRFNSDLLSK
jgi:hypothetical protein